MQLTFLLSALERGGRESPGVLGPGKASIPKNIFMFIEMDLFINIKVHLLVKRMGPSVS